MNTTSNIDHEIQCLIIIRQPPRPSPASVTYSESDIGATPHKQPLPDDDDASSDTTQKPSDLGDSSDVIFYIVILISINLFFLHT